MVQRGTTIAPWYRRRQPWLRGPTAHRIVEVPRVVWRPSPRKSPPPRRPSVEWKRSSARGATRPFHRKSGRRPFLHLVSPMIARPYRLSRAGLRRPHHPRPTPVPPLRSRPGRNSRSLRRQLPPSLLLPQLRRPPAGQRSVSRALPRKSRPPRRRCSAWKGRLVPCPKPLTAQDSRL